MSGSTRRRTGLAGALAAALLGAAPGSALATSLPERTFPVSGTVGATGTDGVLSSDGSSVAFASGGEIYVSSVLTGAVREISVPSSGAAANGASFSPAISADGSVVAFVSTASNLAPGSSGTTSDVFVRAGAGSIQDVSLAPDGSPANGLSLQPAVSADGRYVVFASFASNLVPGDHDSVSDVFLRDRTTGRTTRVSVGAGGVEANGASSTPAISADGRVISFASTATNLAPGDANGVADVFVRIPSTGVTERVSVGSRGAQNAAVAAPFTQISSLSGDGRLVAFDSNATNLVPGEDRRPRSNVFVRDRRRHVTTLISQDNAGYEGNNDSFAPFITPTGLFVTFESFARNLAPGGGPRENVFVRDLNLRTTAVVDVAPGGARPGPELGGELLERPTLAGDGTLATFTSTAANLTGSATGQPQVFLRLLTPPHGLLRAPPRAGRRPVVYVGADDPAATVFECRIDRRLPFDCPRGRLRLPLLAPGTHQLLIRAGGPGLLYDPLGIKVTLRVTTGG